MGQCLVVSMNDCGLALRIISWKQIPFRAGLIGCSLMVISHWYLQSNSGCSLGRGCFAAPDGAAGTPGRLARSARKHRVCPRRGVSGVRPLAEVATAILAENVQHAVGKGAGRAPRARLPNERRHWLQLPTEEAATI
jgi:hypothetical protein